MKLVTINKEKQFSPAEPFIEDFCNVNSIVMFSGMPKIGKSAFCAHLAYSVATGEHLFGHTVIKPGAVIYFTDESPTQTEDRIQKLFGEREPYNVHILDPSEDEEPFYFQKPEDVSRLVRFIRDGYIDPKLIIVDNLSSFYKGSQLDDEAMGEFFRGLKWLSEQFGCVIVLIHHSNKESGQQRRYSSDEVTYRGSGVALAKCHYFYGAVDTKKHDDEGNAIINVRYERGRWREHFNVDLVVRDTLTPCVVDQTPRLTDEDIKTLMVSLAHEPITITEWMKLVKSDDTFMGSLGQKRLYALKDELVENGTIVILDNPKRTNGLLYQAA